MTPAAPEEESDDSETNTTNDGLDELDGRDLDFDIREFDVMNSAWTAVNDQAVACTFFDFEQALPKLAEWTTYLKSAKYLTRAEDREHGAHFDAQIDALSGEFRRLLSANKPVAQNTTPEQRWVSKLPLELTNTHQQKPTNSMSKASSESRVEPNGHGGGGQEARADSPAITRKEVKETEILWRAHLT